MRMIGILVAIMKGDAVVVIREDDTNVAKVTVGKNITRQFAMKSMAGAISQLMTV